jgi:hypothetical protein
MNTSSSSHSASGRNTISPDQALETVRSGIDRIDAERADAYTDLAAFQSARREVFTRHEKLLARKLGAEHPRLAALQVRREAIEALIPDLKTAANVASTPEPEAAAAGYILHGFVRDTERRPVPGAAVAFYDADGKRRTDFKPATTDQNGYFKLAATRLNEAGRIEKPAAEKMPPVALELRVFESRHRQFAAAPIIVTVAPAEVDFATIVVGEPEEPKASAPESVGTAPTSSHGKAASPGGDLRTMAEALRRAPSRSGSERKARAAKTKKTSAKARKKKPH